MEPVMHIFISDDVRAGCADQTPRRGKAEPIAAAALLAGKKSDPEEQPVPQHVQQSERHGGPRPSLSPLQLLDVADASPPSQDGSPAACLSPIGSKRSFQEAALLGSPGSSQGSPTQSPPAPKVRRPAAPVHL